jgi:hypothetical protein
MLLTVMYQIAIDNIIPTVRLFDIDSLFRIAVARKILEL